MKILEHIKSQSIRLSHQAILLVSIPLICQIVFILVLTMLLGQVEREAYKAEHSRNILAETDRLVTLFYKAGTAIATYDMTKNQLFKIAYEKSADKALSQMLVLRRLTQGDKESQSYMDSIDTGTSEMLKTFAIMADKIDRGQNPMSSSTKSMSSLQGIGDQVAGKVAELNLVQRQINAAEPAQEARLRGQVEACLAAGVALNILLALALARIFYRGTASRLNILMQNTQRLVKQEALEPPIPGNDEIAELDTVFRQMAEALNEAAKQKRQFLQMVSHDLRSPLTAAQLSLNLMSAGVKGDISDAIRQEMDSVQSSMGRLVRLINDLLDIEKVESGHMELRKKEVSLELITDNALETVRPLAAAKHITLEQADMDIDLYADGERLSQVMINLVSNAIKAAPENTKISINAAVIEKFAEVKIIDEGPGIDPQHQASIFDRFQQTPDSTSGTGLGLAICKALIEQHGGQIGVISEVGKGSTFWYRIPLVQTNENQESDPL